MCYGVKYAHFNQTVMLISQPISASSLTHKEVAAKSKIITKTIMLEHKFEITMSYIDSWLI